MRRSESREENSVGGSCGASKPFIQALCYNLHMMPCHLPITSNNGMEKTQHAPFVYLQQTWGTFWLATRQTRHKDITPDSTTRCWGTLQVLWRPNRYPSMPYSLCHPILHLQESLSAKVQDKLRSLQNHTLARWEGHKTEGYWQTSIKGSVFP